MARKLLNQVVDVVDFYILPGQAQCWRAPDVVSVVAYINYPAGGSRRSRDVLVKYLRCFPLPRQEVLISLAVERSALPYDSSVRGPRKSLIFGESGGIERFQLAKRVLCASIAERDGASYCQIQLLVASFVYRTYQVVFGHLPWL